MNHKILFVDDEPLVLKMAAIYLKHMAEKIVFATSGEECLEILKNDQDLDHVILDIMMPGIDGIEVLKIIRRNSEFSKLKIIMQTGMLNVDQQLIKDNNATLIFKPYSKESLLALLD
jgi:CheY-like chemotaxis protein